MKELTQQLDELTQAKQDKETAADPRHSARLEIEASLGNKLLQPFIFYCFHNYFLLYSVFRIRIHLVWIRIGYFRLNTDPDPIRIRGFDDQNLENTYLQRKKTI